jgi:ATP-dependent protease HslVU (ClpYQ) peptidase subunit
MGQLNTVGHDAWVFLGAVITTRRKVEQVRKLAEPTGNGYADETKASLHGLEAGQARLQEGQEQILRLVLEHLQDHTRAGLHLPHLTRTPRREGS